MPSHAPSYHGYRFPSEIISHAIWLWFRKWQFWVAKREASVDRHTLQQLLVPVEDDVDLWQHSCPFLGRTLR